MQSQTFFGGDYRVHALLMETFDPDVVRVHVACNRGDGNTPAVRALRAIPGARVRTQSFGPSLYHPTPPRLARELIRHGGPGVAGMTGLLRYMRREGVRVVHCTDRPRDAFYGLLLARGAGARCIVHLHHKAEAWMPGLSFWSMRHADAVVCISTFVAESALAAGVSRDRTFVARNGIDVDAWVPAADRWTLRTELGIPGGRTVVGAVGRICSWKGQLDLLEALSRLRDLDFHLLVVGEDDPGAAPGRPGLTADLRARAADLGISDRVTFAGFRADMARVHATCDVFAMATHEEPFGMVFLEAMAMERPVVAYDSGGVPDIVRHGETGLLAPDGNIDQLARALRTLLVDPELRRRMGQAGRQRAAAEFPLHGTVRRVEEIYRTVLAN